MIDLHFVEQGSAQWIADRIGKYTGSNADKLLKFGAVDYAQATDGTFKGNFWTKRGHLLEDQALDIYQRITGHQLIRDEYGLKVGYVTNSLYPNCLYSPDGLTDEVLVEVKCFDIPNHRPLMQGDIPFKILAQIHFGLFLTGKKLAHLVPFCPKPELSAIDQFKIIPIKASRTINANFRDKLGKDIYVRPA